MFAWLLLLHLVAFSWYEKQTILTETCKDIYFIANLMDQGSQPNKYSYERVIQGD